MQKAYEVFLIKPSRYDVDGYVVQWVRSIVPSNSLGSVAGVFQDCADRRVLGPDVAINIRPFDECNSVIRVERVVAAIRAAGGGMVGLVGVQSNQFPRALDLARQFRAAGITVVIGGFHVSGCLAMLPSMPPEMQEALDLGVTLFAGEGEDRVEGLLQDAAAGKLKPIYNYLSSIPDLAGAALPLLPAAVARRNINAFAGFDAGRGCPFQCSFCTIINVQGRKSRHRTADDVEGILRANFAQGIQHFFITDDNFARNRNWEPILDRIIEFREREGSKMTLIIQVDTLCHRIPNFIEKAGKAGVTSVFIGLENINPESLAGTKKRQNKIWEYREMFQAWRAAGVMTCAGYILGFPTDTPETIARDIEIIKRELPVDILEFFYLTPLPGSEDHKVLHTRGAPMDPDMNNYDLEHVCAAHPRMTQEEWEGAYRNAWERFYTDEHVETVMRRAHTSGLRAKQMLWEHLLVFSSAARIEDVHPLQFGVGRRKIRTQRRHGMPIVPPLPFYAWRLKDSASRGAQWLALALRFTRIRLRARFARASGDDEAMHPATLGNAAQGFVQVFADKIPRTHGAPTAPATPVQ